MAIVRKQSPNTRPLESGRQQRIEKPLSSELITRQPAEKIHHALAIGENLPYLCGLRANARRAQSPPRSTTDAASVSGP